MGKAKGQFLIESFPLVNNWEDEMIEEINDLINTLTGNDLIGYRQSVQDEATDEEARNDILEAFKVLQNCDEYDYAEIRYEGMSFTILVTGGVTDGSAPNELYEALHILNNVDAVLDKVKEFAIEW
jgi:serine/threonine protein phosphatase PrpC